MHSVNLLLGNRRDTHPKEFSAPIIEVSVDMLRVIIILIGGLVAVSAYQTAPDWQAALAAFQNSPHIEQARDYALNWKFASGLALGLVANEMFRVLWRYTKMATEIATVIGGRLVQLAALVSVVGAVLYFI